LQTESPIAAKASRFARPQHAAFVFVFVTVLLDMLAIGIIIPVLPKLVVDFVAGDAADGARIYGLFGTAWALMQFLFSPVQGGLSDRFGRRPVILLSNVGGGLDYIVMALAPSLAWLFLGRVISGITSASISTSYAYVADVTPPAERAGRFGLLGAAFGAGFVLGPALGGVTGAIDPRLPFWIAAGLSLANALYGFFVLPESLPQERRAPFDWRRANPIGALALLRSQVQLIGLASVNFFSNLAHAALPSVGVLYMMYRYGWNERTVGLTMAGVGVASIVVQAGVVGRAVKAFGERRALIIGLTFGVAGFSVFGLAPSGPLFWAGMGHRQSVIAGPDERPHRAAPAGPASGRQRQPHGRRQSDRAGALHHDARGRDRYGAHLGRARRAASPGGAAARARAGGGAAGHQGGVGRIKRICRRSRVRGPGEISRCTTGPSVHRSK
jgi:MFS transporter, DHA1 family, tetracycline resistance protein